jgi:hypothetical protein
LHRERILPFEKKIVKGNYRSKRENQR